MSKKKILVTGGAGFIGSHLCKRLAADASNEVYSLDNYFTGSEVNHCDNVTYIKGNTVDISKLVNFKPDIVYHLGEYSRVEQSYDDIDTVWRYNKDGIFAVLQFMLAAVQNLVMEVPAGVTALMVGQRRQIQSSL